MKTNQSIENGPNFVFENELFFKKVQQHGHNVELQRQAERSKNKLFNFLWYWFLITTAFKLIMTIWRTIITYLFFFLLELGTFPSCVTLIRKNCCINDMNVDNNLIIFWILSCRTVTMQLNCHQNWRDVCFQQFQSLLQFCWENL